MFALIKLKIMNKNPKISLRPTTVDLVLEAFSFIILLAMWSPIIFYYSDLPDSVPIHFNAQGIPDDYGSKSTLLLLPIIGTFAFILLTILNKFPHIFNFPTEITEVNAPKMYRIATTMMRLIKLITTGVLTIIIYLVIQTALGNADGLGSNFIIFSSIAFIIPIVYFGIEISRIKK